MKSNNTVTLVRLGLSLSKNGFVWVRYEWTGKETANSYMLRLKDEIDNEPASSRRINKNSLMKPDNITQDTHKFIAYRVWCLPNQEEAAKVILENKVITLAKQIKKEAEEMFVHLKDK